MRVKAMRIKIAILIFVFATLLLNYSINVVKAFDPPRARIRALNQILQAGR